MAAHIFVDLSTGKVRTEDKKSVDYGVKGMKKGQHRAGPSQSQLRAVRNFNPNPNANKPSKQGAEQSITKIKSQMESLRKEGESKKSSNGAYPKDIIRKLDRLRAEHDKHYQVIKHGNA